MVEHSHGKAAMRVRFSLSAFVNMMTIVSPAEDSAGGAMVFYWMNVYPSTAAQCYNGEKRKGMEVCR